MDGPGSESQQAQVTFLPSKRYGQLWDPPGLKYNLYRGSFPEEKCQGCETDHSTPYREDIKNEWNSSSITFILIAGTETKFSFVDLASLYKLVNKANLVHNLFLVYLSTSTCFGRLWAHHQEKQLDLCDTWYL